MDPALQYSKEKHMLPKNMSGRYLSSKSLDKIGLEKPMYCSYIVEFYEVCNLIERDDLFILENL